MKTVLITGVSKGIGKAMADRFLTEGFRVIGTSTSGKADLSHENLTIYQLDLSSPESIDHCCAEIARSGVTVDILMNNAGALFDDDETHVIVDKLRKTLEVNLVGTIDFTEHIIPLIKQRVVAPILQATAEVKKSDTADANITNINTDPKVMTSSISSTNTIKNPKTDKTPDQAGQNDEFGHIVSTSSTAGSLTLTASVLNTHFPYHYPAYKISKCALNMYTATLAKRLSHENTGIIVSSVHPGWVRTDMGGAEAEVTPEQAAEDIFQLAISRPETGCFWYKGRKLPW